MDFQTGFGGRRVDRFDDDFRFFGPNIVTDLWPVKKIDPMRSKNSADQ